jgi:hypothetical protein
VFVYETEEAARPNQPKCVKEGRFHLYKCTSVDGRTCWVWERNLNVAAGRAARHLNVITIGSQGSSPKTPTQVVNDVAGFDEETRARILEQIAKLPPAVRQAVPTSAVPPAKKQRA